MRPLFPNLITPMRPRDPAESHRTASPLELFFDLVFVVAVSMSSQQLHHMEASGHAGAGVLGYLMVFFAIWWAWMNFTWFATAFGTDDIVYRLMTFVQMAGVLVLAAGTSRAMAEQDFTIVVIGYVIMRFALVGQWLRAAASHPAMRRLALRYAAAIAVIQVLWLARLALPESLGLVSFLVLMLAEIAVPVWAEWGTHTPWNPHHIAERYSLFTLILLGESILASTGAVVEAVDAGRHVPDLLIISATGLIIAAGMWWVYFSRPQHQHIRTRVSTLTFGYFHYVIFAAAGAFSAGIEVAVDTVGGETELAHLPGAAMLSVPVGLFLLGIWWLTIRHTLTATANALYLGGAAIVLLAPFAPGLATLTVTAIGVALAVAATELRGIPREADEPGILSL